MLIGITAKARNGLMLKYRLQQGGIPQRVAAERAGVPHGTWCAAECMNFRKVYLGSLKKIAVLLDCDPQALCPEELRHSDCRLARTVYREANAQYLLGYEESRRLTLPDPADVAELHDLRDMQRVRLKAVLNELTFREREIIRLRFGLNDDAREHTLSEVGKIFKVTRERVREIEARAIRKLQTPVMAKFLEPVVDADGFGAAL